MEAVSLIYAKENECYEDYMVRLFENMDSYGVSCKEIANLLNQYRGVQYDESTYRKFYRAFSAGMEYERQKQSGNVYTRILGISDLHCPFNLPVETFSEFAGAIDTLVLGGDITDMYACSRFPKEMRIDVVQELVQTRSYLIELIEYLAPKNVVAIYGNHDARLGSYVTNKIENDVKELLPKTSLEYIFEDGFHHYDRRNRRKEYYEPLSAVFADSGVKINYTGNWWAMVGETIFCHPSAYSGVILKTASKAVDHFLRVNREFSSLVLAHTHKLGSYFQGDIAMYEQGACCKVELMNYNDGKLTMPQQKGFIYVAQDADGRLLPDKTRLIFV